MFDFEYIANSENVGTGDLGIIYPVLSDFCLPWGLNGSGFHGQESGEYKKVVG